MLNLPRWQTIAIIVVTLLAGLLALPNLLPDSVVVVESYHLEQCSTVEAIPVADTGLRSRHRRHLPQRPSRTLYTRAWAL